MIVVCTASKTIISMVGMGDLGKTTLVASLLLTGKLEKVQVWFHSFQSLYILDFVLVQGLTQDCLPHFEEPPNLTKLWLTMHVLLLMCCYGVYISRWRLDDYYFFGFE